MIKRCKNIVFIVIWILCFYHIIFNEVMRERLFSLCYDNAFLSPIIFILIQVVLASFVLPCSTLSVLAGILWGWQLGLLYSTVATATSSLCTFILGRYVVKKIWLEKKDSLNWLKKICKLIERFGWKASMIAHANPVFPGSSLGYIFGASEISLKSFLIGVVMGTLPLQVITVQLGHVAGRNIAELNASSLLVACVIIFALIVYKIIVPRVLTRLGRIPTDSGQ